VVPPEHAARLAHNLPRFHGCGVGPDLPEATCRAVVAVRVASLAVGCSGVRPLIVENLCRLLNARVAPRIPSRGSVGASGDLTPLSYVAALLTGERQAWLEGTLVASAEALQAAAVQPVRLGPKESLAIMNGTSVMVAESCLALMRAERLARVASALTAMMIEATEGQVAHFDERLFRAKPHPGGLRSAEWIRTYLGVSHTPAPRGPRIQERYCLRCAPHIVGALVDALDFSRGVLDTEINGASDNPLIDVKTGDVLHGGNFYGAHAALVADLLKTQVANLADLMERQLVLLNDPAQNGGLPENLVAATGADRCAQHGFKAMEITASALTAEALKATMPASVFSRSTEQHNQDKVSMGSLAARDLTHILDLTETVAAVHLLACAQAIELRGEMNVSAPIRALHARVRALAEPVTDDRPMDADIVAVLEGLIGSDAPWTLD
jgi:histidine ammonia-lyase